MLAELYKIYSPERVLDLVTVDGRDARVARLRNEPKWAGEKKSSIDVIVVCRIGREGMDWVPCSWLHNASPENSITLAVQTIGRPFRRFQDKIGRPVKDRVHIVNYIPEFVRPSKNTSFEELLTDRLNAVLFLMQLNEMSHPLIVPSINPRKPGRALGEYFGSQYQKMKKDLFQRVESIEAATDAEYAVAVEKMIDSVLSEYKPENRDNVKKALFALVVRAKSKPLRELGIDVSFLRKAGFPSLVRKHDLRRKTIFFREHGFNEFKRLRRLVENSWWKKGRACKNAGLR